MNDQAIVRAVVGLRGYGKTTKVTSLAAACPRVLYYDSLGDDYRDGIIIQSAQVLNASARCVSAAHPESFTGPKIGDRISRACASW
jgi:hypothetical protein